MCFANMFLTEAQNILKDKTHPMYEQIEQLMYCYLFSLDIFRFITDNITAFQDRSLDSIVYI